MLLVMLNALSQWLYLPAWAVLAFACYARIPALAAASGALVLAHVWWVDPRGLVASAPPATEHGTPFRVMSVNLLAINDDVSGISQEVLAARPDILLVQELSPPWLARFGQQDLQQLLPFRRAIVRQDSFGIGVYSRTPLEADELRVAGFPAFDALVKLGGQRLRVLNVHTFPPRAPEYVATWREMMEQITHLARARRGPTLLGGDLNATVHQAYYQGLLATGLRGVHEETGRTLATTWPNGLMPVPPMRLDHLLISSELAVLGVREGEGRGSDHRPIIADLVLR